jgi:hypothetical protein
VVYLLGALLDGGEKVHGQPEAVCRKVVQKRDLGISHVNLCGLAPLSLVFGHGVHLLFEALSTDKVVIESCSRHPAKLVDHTWN